MSSTESASFALDLVHRSSRRLDSIQDALTASEQFSAQADEEEYGEQKQKLIKVASGINAQVIQSKTLLDSRQISAALDSLQQHGSSAYGTQVSLRTAAIESSDDPAVAELIATARLTYAAYALVLDSLLKQAELINDQAWYWQEVEEDSVQTVRYLVQTLPSRLINLVTVVAKKLSESTPVLSTRGDASHTSVTLNTDTIRRAWYLVRDSPTLAIGAIFPLSAVQDADRADGRAEGSAASFADGKKKKQRSQLVSAARIFTPLGLTRHEARAKRAKLNKERDVMATQVGVLAQNVSRALENMQIDHIKELDGEIRQRVQEMQNALANGEADVNTTQADGKDLNSVLDSIVTVQFSRQRERVDTLLSAAPVGLGRPSRLARAWPTLVIGPVATLIVVRLVTQNWAVILEKVEDARETVRGFFVNWVYDPCVKLLDTIRTGDQEGVIITPESLNSDLQSLERMVTDFNKEKYGLQGDELDDITAKVRQGDLTTVLRIYESELKNPLRSAISGSLVRSLLIQIQKVKVDIAVAMRGVDQLLKSQQLLFGAIGIAPAMAILYVGGGFVRSRIGLLLGTGSGRPSKSVLQATRYRAWEAMRRIDRLLSDPALDNGRAGNDGEGEPTLPPLTQGLLLLDLALLRKLAPLIVAQASVGSIRAGGKRAKRLRSEFLQDVRDLESTRFVSEQSTVQAAALPGIGWYARRAAVDRMWKSWGGFMSIDR